MKNTMNDYKQIQKWNAAQQKKESAKNTDKQIQAYQEEKKRYCLQKATEHLGNECANLITSALIAELPHDYRMTVDDRYKVLLLTLNILSEMEKQSRVIQEQKLNRTQHHNFSTALFIQDIFIYRLDLVLKHKAIVERTILECELQSSLQVNTTKTKKLKL